MSPVFSSMEVNGEMQANERRQPLESLIVRNESYKYDLTKRDLERIEELERTTSIGLSVTNVTPKKGEVVTFVLTLWRLSAAKITELVPNARVVVWRTDGGGTPTRMVVTTNANGQVSWRESYSDLTELTYRARYTPPQ